MQFPVRHILSLIFCFCFGNQAQIIRSRCFLPRVEHFFISRYLLSPFFFFFFLVFLLWLQGNHYITVLNNIIEQNFYFSIVHEKDSILLPSHGQRSLEGYSPWGCKRFVHNLRTKQQYRKKITTTTTTSKCNYQ